MGGSSRRPIHFISEFYGSSGEWRTLCPGRTIDGIRPATQFALRTADRKRHTKNDKCFWSVSRFHSLDTTSPQTNRIWRSARSLCCCRISCPVSLFIVRPGPPLVCVLCIGQFQFRRWWPEQIQKQQPNCFHEKFKIFTLAASGSHRKNGCIVAGHSVDGRAATECWIASGHYKLM